MKCEVRQAVSIGDDGDDGDDAWSGVIWQGTVE